MAKKLIKWLQMSVFATGLVLSMSGWSDEAEVGATDVERERPGFHLVFWDAVLVKPIGLISTVVGSALFVVTLPVTLPTGTVGEAGATLVGDPFMDTFMRCLGCTEVGWRKLPVKELEQ